jgi:anti-anti-sigma factor
VTVKRLTTTVEQENDRARLLVVGELDLGTRDEFITAALDALARTQDVLELNLAGVTYCDSSGISGLLAVSRLSRDVGKRAVVTQPAGQVARALEMTGTIEMLAGGDSV